MRQDIDRVEFPACRGDDDFADLGTGNISRNGAYYEICYAFGINILQTDEAQVHVLRDDCQPRAEGAFLD